MQFERRVGSVRILNAGSVGMPYADRPGAYWLLLGPEGSEFRTTTYDVETAAQQVRESGYPQAQDFAEENMLKVPTAAEAMAVFERRAWTVTCFTPMELSNWHRDLSTTKPFPTLIHNKRDPIRTA